MGCDQSVELLKLPPQPVLGMRVSSYGPTFITLEWPSPRMRSDVATVTEYKLECNGTGCSSCTVPAKDCAYTFVDLLPASEYGFRVWARSPAGWSPPSPRLLFLTSPHVPSPPPPVELLKTTSNGLLLSWHEPPQVNGSPVSEYELELRQAIEDGWVRELKHKSLKRSRFIVGLVQGEAYKCRVRARNLGGWSNWSEFSSAHLVPGVPVWLEKTQRMLVWSPPILSGRHVTNYEGRGFMIR
jgi:hypothetical protein